MNWLSVAVAGAVFAAGALAMTAGVVRINRLQFRLGGVLLIIGLLLAIGAGQDLRQRFFLPDAQRKIRDTELALSRAREQRARIEKQRSRLESELQRIARDLRGRVGANDLEARMVADADVRSSVERAVQVRRWIAECEAALAELIGTEKSLENTLFYMRNLVAMERIGDERIGGALAKDLEERLKEQSQTPAGGAVALPPSGEEVAAIRALLVE